MPIRNTTQIAQPVAEASALPSKIPTLPDEVVRRFKSAAEFNQALQKFWSSTRDLLIRDHNEVAFSANQSAGQQRLLSAQADSLLAEIRSVNQAMIDGDAALALQISTISSGTGGVHTYLQSSTPTGMSTGDIWFKTDEGFRQYRYDGSTWVPVDDARIGGTVAALSTETLTRASETAALTSTTQALVSRLNTGDIATAISSLQTAVGPSGSLSQRIDALAASSGNHIYFQATAPSGANVSDLWYDTSNGNKPYVWNGTAWVSATESALVQATASINTITSTYATKTYAEAMRDDAITAATTSANSYTAGQISSLASVYATKSYVDSSISTTLTSAANDAQSRVNIEANTRATVDGYLSGKYTIRVDSNGSVAGMNITSTSGGGTNTSEVSFLSSVFKIYTSSGSVAPFIVSGNTVRISGSLIITASDVSGLGTLATQNGVSTSQVSGLGSLATVNSVDMISQVYNKSLANLDSTAANKLSGIEAGATVGASWSGNLTGRPLELTDGRIVTALNSSGTVVTRVVPGAAANPSGSGLYLGSDRLGFYNGSVWKTYMDNTGNFYLSGNSNNSLAWDGTTLSISGDITCDTGRLTAGRVSFYYKSSGGSVLSLNSRGGVAGVSLIQFSAGNDGGTNGSSGDVLYASSSYVYGDPSHLGIFNSSQVSAETNYSYFGSGYSMPADYNGTGNTLIDSNTVRIRCSSLTVTGLLSVGSFSLSSLALSGGFGCNGKTAQSSYSVGTNPSSYSPGNLTFIVGSGGSGYGFQSSGEYASMVGTLNSLTTFVGKIATALKNNGICV